MRHYTPNVYACIYGSFLQSAVQNLVISDNFYIGNGKFRH